MSSLFSFGPPKSTAPNPFFTATTTAPAQSSALFGGQQQSQPAPSLFGSSMQTQQQPAPSLFGNNTQNQQPFNSILAQSRPSVFGTSASQQQPNSFLGGTNAQQPQQPQQQQQQQQLGQTQYRVWNEADLQPRQKSVQDQITTLAQKWDPTTPISPFKTYLYNNVGKEHRPFYGPGQLDDEEKWESALRSAPSDSTIPILVSGFQQLGSRITMQASVLGLLQGRLHEINNGLTALLRRHDLEIAPRAAECRRRHVRLAKKTIELASKTQVLRNRGYAMDVGEEELRVKLVELERKVMDPGLEGRTEEIWARMVILRDRGRMLEAEMERVGRAAAAVGNQGKEGAIDEETLKRVKKILEGYDSQITHLNKEMEEIKKEFEDWENPRNGGNGRAR